MALTIPKSLQTAALDVFKLNETGRTQLLEGLKAVPSGSPPSSYDKELSERLPQQTSEWRSRVLAFIFSFSNLLDTNTNVDNLANDFVVALRQVDDDLVRDATDEDFVKFYEFIQTIFEDQDVIGLGAKAFRLMLQHERVFVLSEVFSDIRSVFSVKGANQPPLAAIISHTLKIHAHKNDEHKEFYFALNYKDLEELKKTIERAMEKHKTLSEVIKKADMTYLEPGGESA
jgi:hypothetical protein